MTDQELKDLIADTAKLQAENAKEIKRIHKELGWIGNQWGRFTEGLFYQSLERMLMQDFAVEKVNMRVTSRNNGSTMEVDVLGYSNGSTNVAVIVEVKSTLRDDDIRDFLKLLEKFPKHFPEHKDKKIIAMLAAVSISSEQKTLLEKLGIYVVRIKDDVFRIVSKKDFKPKDFGLNP